MIAKAIRGFAGGSDGKESACQAGDRGLIPGLGRAPLEKEVATHSNILVWKIPRTEEPGGLWSMGLQNQTQLDNLTITKTHRDALLLTWGKIPTFKIGKSLT